MSADVLSVSRREGSRDRWLRRVSVRRPQALVAALIALAVSLFLGGSAASQEASDQTPAVDVSGVKVDIAVYSDHVVALAEAPAVPVTADAGSAGSEILIAPYPPVVGETVLVELRGDDTTSTGKKRHINFDGPRRLTEPGTHTVEIRECAAQQTDCVVVAERTFEVGTVNTRPAVDVAIDISPAVPIRNEPLTITVQAGGGVEIRETSVRLRPHTSGDSGISSSTTYTTKPVTAGSNTIAAAVCFAGAARTCELITRKIVVERPGTGTVASPAAATDLTTTDLAATDPAVAEWRSSEPGLRLRWTDTNQVESGYRVSAGPSLSELSLLGEYPRDTTGIFTTDTTDECFEVRVVFGDVVGPSATHCHDEPLPEPSGEIPPLSILTSAQPVAGETVTFLVNGLRPEAWPLGGGFGTPPLWSFGDPLLDDSTAATVVNTHVFASPGEYEVSVRDEFGNVVTTVVTVRAMPSGTDTGLRAPTNIEFFAEPDGVYPTFTDTNSAEDGYRVSNLSGWWIDHTGPDATSASGAHWYSEYNDPPRCIEIRAFKDNLLGPPATSCAKSPLRPAGLHVTGVSMSPGSEPGQLNVQYSYDVWSDRLTWHHEIAAIDVDLGFDEYYTSEPRCYQTRNERPAWSPFDYETGALGVDLVRTLTVTIDGLATGRTYAAGFAYQADGNGPTHPTWLRAELACRRHWFSPEVVAP